MKKIRIATHLGSGFDYFDMLRLIHQQKLPVAFVNPNHFTINGVTYEQIEEMRGVRLTPSIYGCLMYERKRPNVGIREEFELIQKKQSKLCRSDRDWVVGQFFRLYKKVEV